jgi:predicted dehydrogenase
VRDDCADSEGGLAAIDPDAIDDAANRSSTERKRAERMSGDAMTAVAVVGTGRMGEAHARAWSALGPDVEVVAAVGHHSARRLVEAPRARPTTDLDAVLADPGVEILSICTPTDTHLDLTARALAAGKHVLLEKPLARSLSQGEQLIELARNASGMLMVAHVVRFFPGYVATRTLVEEGALGDVLEVRAHRLSPAGGRPAWLDDDERSGGVLLDLAVHDFDQLVLFLGPARRVRALPAANGTIEVVVEHDRGISRVRAGWDLPRDLPFSTLLEVVGTAGRARCSAASGPDGTSELEVDAAGGAWRTVIDAGNPYAAQARYFLGCVQAASAPEDGDPATSLLGLRLALAAADSLSTRGPVDVP